MPYLNVYISPFHSPALNFALENLLMEELETNEPSASLLFYENLNSIILGRTLEYEREVYSHKRHPKVFRRASGGGSVIHFRGNLNYSLIASTNFFPVLRNVRDSYEFISKAVSTVLPQKFKPGMQGLSDISVYQSGSWKKISGNAQKRKRDIVLHHGTMLYSLKHLSLIPHYLRHPPKEPDYRAQRTHRDFLIQVPPVNSRAKLISGISVALATAFKLTLQKKKPDFSSRLISQNVEPGEIVDYPDCLLMERLKLSMGVK